jgi:hypothetical protein
MSSFQIREADGWSLVFGSGTPLGHPLKDETPRMTVGLGEIVDTLFSVGSCL